MKSIVDSDFLFGLFVPTDPHHNKAKGIFIREKKNESNLVVLNLVLQETATVLSHKVNQKLALDFIKKFNELEIQIIYLDEELENRTWKIFNSQTKKGTSFIDCANVAVTEKYKLDGIVSFDEFYPKKLRVGMVE
jgi:predicted nucleic acid-binding protein